MPRLSHPDDNLVFACPDCDSSGTVFRRVREAKHEYEHHCHLCGEEFDQPVEREKYLDAPANKSYHDDGLPRNRNQEIKDALRQTRGSVLPDEHPHSPGDETS